MPFPHKATWPMENGMNPIRSITWPVRAGGVFNRYRAAYRTHPARPATKNKALGSRDILMEGRLGKLNQKSLRRKI